MPSPTSHVLFSGVHQKTPRRPKWLAFPKISKGLSMCRAEDRYSRISRGSPKTFYDQVMFRFLTTYKYFSRHPLFLQSIFHGSIASYQNLSLLLPWCVLFFAKKKDIQRSYMSASGLFHQKSLAACTCRYGSLANSYGFEEVLDIPTMVMVSKR
jgi:hypothetical protein